MTIHKSVLLEETIEALNLKKGSVVVDATLGGGGHSREILKIIGDVGKLIVIDADAGAVERFKSKMEEDGTMNVIAVNDNFRNLERILQYLEVEKVDAILADIGYSSDQLEDPERGISFQLSSPLDMRFDQKQDLTAEKIVNEYGQAELERVIKEYGEEKFYKSITKGILAYRKDKRIKNTKELVGIIENHVPERYRHGRISPATKTFQAIRIEVNRELDSLTQFLVAAVGALAPHGRLAVISFHSLEDRIVKEFFRENARGCICPQDFPVCLCGNLAKLTILSRKPIISGPDEVEGNPRSRSAKLRVCEKNEE
jgi:16S rRNA (cytosine1402-N4)-methyltransferase